MNAPARIAPTGLWSLWDMVTPLNSELMPAVTNLSGLAHQFLVLRRQMTGPERIEIRYLASAAKSLETIAPAADDLKLPASCAAVARCREVLAAVRGDGWLSENDMNALGQGCAQVAQAFQDELGARLVFSLPSVAANLLNATEPHFGRSVEDAFPLAAEDIAEAAKCLAFGRYTATVFHLMRAMEAAVQKLASEVGVDHVDKEWGKLLSDIGKAVELMPKGAGRDRWSESHSHLYHVKQAWRNDTMHPKKTYTEDEASGVYQAVKSFMTHLASLVT